MEFRDPIFLALALIAPLAFLAAARSSCAVQFSSLSILQGARRSWRERFAALPAALLALATLSLAVAAAGPRTPDASTRVSRDGIAIMAVIDRSGSMHARDLVEGDLSADRLSVVKQVFREFVLGGEAGRGRPDDLIGLVGFAGYADSLCPLTLDHGNLVAMVEDLQIVQTQGEDGTALGDGLALASERLRESKAKSKVVVLLTDGVSNAGVIAPDQAAELAAANHIKVYCIGAGTDGLAPFPVIDPFTGRGRLEPRYVEIDEETLREIADRTGGRYYRATNKDKLGSIYAEIDRLERTEITELRYLQYNDHYTIFVLASLCLIAVSALAGSTVFRTLP